MMSLSTNGDGRPAPPVKPNLDRSEFLNSILESAIEYSIVALDLSGSIVAWNEGARRLYGYTAEEVVGKESGRILLAPSDIQTGRDGVILSETLKDGRWVGNLHRVGKDGAPFMTHATFTLRCSAAGEPLGFTMISRKLTEPEREASELEDSTKQNAELRERLQASTETFRALTDAAQQVFFVVSPDYEKLFYASPSYAAIWGESVDSLYRNPRSWFEAIHPQDKARAMAELSRSEDGRIDVQYRIVRKDGVIRWILARAGQIKDGAGEVTRVCGMAMDITDLKKAQFDVVKSERKYRRLFESAKDGILILDADSGDIVEINPFVLQLLGYSAEECRGKKLWDIGFFEDVEGSKQLFKDLQSKGYVRYEDMPLKTKAGAAIAVEFVSNLYVVAGGPVIQCNIRDITERKRGEQGLRRLASIIDSCEEAIVGAGLDATINTWNSAAERLFGYRVEEVMGKNVSILCPPELRAEHSGAINDVLTGTSSPPRETACVAKSGKTIPVSLSLSPIKDGAGATAGFSGFCRDITQKNQLEIRLRQSQKMEGIGRLAGGIAHDFNNLLTGILGYGELLLERLPPNDPRRDDVAEIVKSGNRAAALTRQLLAFSRQQALATRVLDINVSVAELDKMLRRIIGEDIVLKFLPAAGLGHVRSAPGQIEQIIMNLCVNAKDAMAGG